MPLAYRTVSADGFKCQQCQHKDTQQLVTSHQEVHCSKLEATQCNRVHGRHVVLVHGQVTIIFVVSVCLSVCLFVQSFSQPSSIRFGSN